MIYFICSFSFLPGIASGGGLYFIATFSVSALIFLLRFGPRLEKDEDEEQEQEEEREKELSTREESREEVIPINVNNYPQRLPYPQEIRQYQSVDSPSKGPGVKKRKKQAQFVS